MSAVRKSDRADLRKHYPLYVGIGLLISLGLLVVAFNVQWMPEDDVEFENEEHETVEMKQIEQTQQIEKPPPPLEPQVPVEVPDDETVVDASIDLSAELDVNTNQNQQQPPPEEEEEESEPEIFVAVEQGEVPDVRVVRSLGAGCDEAAVEAIRSTEFRPGRQRGKPVKVRMQQQIVIRLD